MTPVSSTEETLDLVDNHQKKIVRRPQATNIPLYTRWGSRVPTERLTTLLKLLATCVLDDRHSH